MLIELAERKLLPDAAIRFGIRRLLADRLRSERNVAARGEERVRRMRQLFASGPIAESTYKANAQHYEVPTELFKSMLGPRLKYSSCFWDQASTLADAEDAMLALTCQRARIAGGQRILDLGCGWGSLSLWLAEHYPSSEIVAVSNSRTQGEYIYQQAHNRGFENLRHIVANVAADLSPFEDIAAAGRFDRVVSVEMFEHMHNVEALLNRLSGVLDPKGLLFVHIFSHQELSYRFQDSGKQDWMAQHFFTGGAMPPADLFQVVHGPFEQLQQWEVSGNHYKETCRAWLRNLDAHREPILARLRQEMSSLEAGRQWQRWRIFVMACEELFAWNSGNEWSVTHHLLRRRE